MLDGQYKQRSIPRWAKTLRDEKEKDSLASLENRTSPDAIRYGGSRKQIKNLFLSTESRRHDVFPVWIVVGGGISAIILGKSNTGFASSDTAARLLFLFSVIHPSGNRSINRWKSVQPMANTLLGNNRFHWCRVHRSLGQTSALTMHLDSAAFAHLLIGEKHMCVEIVPTYRYRIYVRLSSRYQCLISRC